MEWRPGPLTSNFSVIGKVTPSVAEQKLWISSALPGSWSPNWVHGQPIPPKPLPAYSSCSSSSCAYCGVRPHFEATLTRRSALPLWAARLPGLPSSVWMGASKMSVAMRGDYQAEARSAPGAASRDLLEERDVGQVLRPAGSYLVLDELARAEEGDNETAESGAPAA